MRVYRRARIGLSTGSAVLGALLLRGFVRAPTGLQVTFRTSRN
jgi:hypothetical protein